MDLKALRELHDKMIADLERQIDALSTGRIQTFRMDQGGKVDRSDESIAQARAQIERLRQANALIDAKG